MEPIDNASWDEQLQALDGSFLQSSAWAVFQEKSGHKVHRLRGGDWSCQLIEQSSKLRKYLLAPYGPSLASADALPRALKAITDYGRSVSAQWVRIEPCLPLTEDTTFDQSAFKKQKVLQAPKQVNPRHTRVIDLSPDEQTLLSAVSSNTRRLIRQSADSPPVTFQTTRDPSDMRLFLDMIHTVSKRNDVQFHSDDYFLKQAGAMMPLDVMRLELALLNGKPIAAIVMHDFNKTATYTYAASLPEAREVDASALLLWQAAIVNSKRSGMTRLDLFGVAPEDAPASHPWHGFSAFKRKFGGSVVERGQTLDIPLSPRYYPYRAALKAKRLI